MGQSMQTMHMLTKPQAFYDESHKTTLSYQNTLYLSQVQRKVPTLYDSHTIVKQHDPLSVPDTEETLGLAEESSILSVKDCVDVINAANIPFSQHANVLPVNNNSLEHDNFASELLKHENDCLMEMLISQDLGHTVVNCLAAMNNYKNMEKSFME
ncbi:hypothetical protein Tco_0971069 [Tanacetum coccineum]